MLRNQESEQPFPSPSSQAPSGALRVTPDELSQALAAIESRKQAEAAHLAGTIPIDQAVSDLHLDSTSDEIWAEVQAQRAKAAAAQEAKQRGSEQQQEAKPQKGALPFQVTPAPLLRLQSGKSGVRPRGWRRLIAPVLVIGVLMGTGVIPHSFTPHGFSPSLLTKGHSPTAAPVLKPLSAFPDGKEVYADDAALIQISEGKPAAQVIVSQNPSGSRWTLVKTSGHVYLRGYIAETDSLKSLAGKALNIYNDNNSGELDGESVSEVTLPVDNVPLEKSGGNEDYSEVTVLNFQPNSSTTLNQ